MDDAIKNLKDENKVMDDALKDLKEENRIFRKELEMRGIQIDEPLVRIRIVWISASLIKGRMGDRGRTDGKKYVSWKTVLGNPEDHTIQINIVK